MSIECPEIYWLDKSFLAKYLIYCFCGLRSTAANEPIHGICAFWWSIFADKISESVPVCRTLLYEKSMYDICIAISNLLIFFLNVTRMKREINPSSRISFACVYKNI